MSGALATIFLVGVQVVLGAGVAIDVESPAGDATEAVQKAIDVIANKGVERKIQGRNFPFGFCFFANILSINAPIIGSLIASQTFHTSNKTAKRTVSTPNTFV